MPQEERKIIDEDIKTVQWGWPLGMPLVRPLEGGLFEVRSKLANRIACVLFCTHGPQIILLHGFIKKTKQTPDDDMKLVHKKRLKSMATHKNIGSDFDSFLAEEGILGEVEAIAAKRILTYQIHQEMEIQCLTKTEMAAKMQTSRAAVNRLLDPQNTAVTLKTLEQATAALGKQLRITIEDPAKT